MLLRFSPLLPTFVLYHSSSPLPDRLMNTPEPSVGAAAAAPTPGALPTPVQGFSLARRNSQKPQALTGLRFLNELLDDHDDHDHDNDDVRCNRFWTIAEDSAPPRTLACSTHHSQLPDRIPPVLLHLKWDRNHHCHSSYRMNLPLNKLEVRSSDVSLRASGTLLFFSCNVFKCAVNLYFRICSRVTFRSHFRVPGGRVCTAGISKGEPFELTVNENQCCAGSRAAYLT
jgi:hypothetical protein